MLVGACFGHSISTDLGRQRVRILPLASAVRAHNMPLSSERISRLDKLKLVAAGKDRRLAPREPLIYLSQNQGSARRGFKSSGVLRTYLTKVQ